MECPLCGSFGLPVLVRGEVTGIEINTHVVCDSSFHRRFWNGWGNVPSRFHSVSLETLAPLADLAISHDRQATMIAALQRNPQDSYLMFGKPNTEKTHLMVALYREALQKGTRREIGMNHVRQSVWRVRATVLINQTVVWALERGKEFKTWSKEPLVTSEKIELAVKDGYRPCLFLDELDKVAVTDFKLSRLCDLIDRIYEAEGQVVATMNKSPEDLAAKWGENEAGTILRRIGGGHGANTVRFDG